MGMMRTYIIFLLVSCIFAPLEAKYTKRQKSVIRKFKKQRQIAYDLEVELNSMNTTLTGTQCGPFTLSSYSTNLNWYSAAGTSADASDPFASGTFTSPINGWYHIC